MPSSSSRSRSRSNRFKRPYNNKRRSIARRYGTTVPRANAAASTLQKAVRRALARESETKVSQSEIADYQQIQHNSFINIFPNNILATTPGVNDPTSGNTQNRIGDKITLLKCSIRMMLELNERYSDVTYRIIITKSARGDTPTINTLFKGMSGNKMLDEINYERYSVIYQKWGKIKAPNMTGGDAPTIAATGSGIYVAGGQTTANYLSRATKILKINIDGKKFAKDGIIQYEGPANSTLQKFFDYNVFVYAYSNYSTIAPTSLTSGYNVLAVNDAFVKLSFKDL